MGAISLKKCRLRRKKQPSEMLYIPSVHDLVVAISGEPDGSC